MEVKQIGSLSDKKTQSRTVYDTEGVSPTLCSGMDHGNTMPYICENITCKLDKMPDGTLTSINEAKICDVGTETASTITARYYKGIGAHKDNMCIVAMCDRQPMIIDDTYANREPRVYEDFSPSLRSEREGFKTIVAMRGRNPENPSDRTVGSPTEQRLEPNSQGICNTLTSVTKDNLVMEVKQVGFMDNGTGKHQSNTVYDEKGVCPNITTIDGGTQQIKVATETVKIKQATQQGYIECELGGVADLSFPDSKTRRGRVQENGRVSPALMAGDQDVCRIENRYRIRKLTEKECWLLMDFSAEDFSKAREANSRTQLYKQAGNSIARNVLVAIIGQMIPGKENIYKEIAWQRTIN